MPSVFFSVNIHCVVVKEILLLNFSLLRILYPLNIYICDRLGSCIYSQCLNLRD